MIGFINIGKLLHLLETEGDSFFEEIAVGFNPPPASRRALITWLEKLWDTETDLMIDKDEPLKYSGETAATA
jgi:hypothetical protein